MHRVRKLTSYNSISIMVCHNTFPAIVKLFTSGGGEGKGLAIKTSNA
ncbi:MAG TPA: hypothetical protein PK509_15460 [Catalimonadaceae bacterium]|nr:hypothetical protein [Catalimonadaceae bacterium]